MTKLCKIKAFKVHILFQNIYIYIKLCIMKDNNANQMLQLTKHMTLSPFSFFQELAFKHILRN